LKIIVAFCGKAGCGKDAAADYLRENFGFTRVAFADELKRIARDEYGWDGIKDDRGRKLLQDIGAYGRAYDPDIWIKKMFASGNYQEADFVAVTDCRYPNEVEALQERDASIILIYGRGGLEGEAGEHESETALDTRENWDYEINNSATWAALFVQLDMIITTIKHLIDAEI